MRMIGDEIPFGLETFRRAASVYIGYTLSEPQPSLKVTKK